MENFLSFIGFLLAVLSLISFIWILCGGKKKSGGGKSEKKNGASSKRTQVMAINSKKENYKKPAKNEQSLKHIEETLQTEDPDLKSRDTYDVKTQEEKQEIEKIKAES